MTTKDLLTNEDYHRILDLLSAKCFEKQELNPYCPFSIFYTYDREDNTTVYVRIDKAMDVKNYNRTCMLEVWERNNNLFILDKNVDTKHGTFRTKSELTELEPLLAYLTHDKATQPRPNDKGDVINTLSIRDLCKIASLNINTMVVIKDKTCDLRITSVSNIFDLADVTKGHTLLFKVECEIRGHIAFTTYLTAKDLVEVSENKFQALYDITDKGNIENISKIPYENFTYEETDFLCALSKHILENLIPMSFKQIINRIPTDDSCPYCMSDRLMLDNSNNSGDVIRQTYTCSRCNHKHTKEYKITFQRNIIS